MSASLHGALSAIPEGLRTPLVDEFTGLLAEYRAGRWEAVGLSTLFSQGTLRGPIPLLRPSRETCSMRA